MDTVSKKKRSEIMSNIRSKDTLPERKVRKLVFSLGYRYRLHYKKLPGKPDLAFPRIKKVIFVHGCFWHQHKKCSISHKPLSNKSYWHKKLDRNVKRDKENRNKLSKLDWKSLVIWECQTKKPQAILKKINAFLSTNTS